MTEKRLFITDDDADDREFLSIALERGGFRGNITNFSNGEKLFEYLNSHPAEQPSLIVLDLNMPKKDGFDTLRDLKKDELLKSIPVVILTSSSRSDDALTCASLGCEHFYNKPSNITAYNELTDILLGYMK